MAIDVFISYSRVDESFVVELDEFLRRAGASVWFDKKSLLPGRRWEDEIEDQIRTASVFLSCLSNAGLEKHGYFHAEQHLAAQAALRRPSEKVFIIPIALGKCVIPRNFRQYNVVDMTEPGAVDLLLSSLSKALEHRTV